MGKKDTAIVVVAKTAGTVSATVKVLSNPFRGRPQTFKAYYNDTVRNVSYLGYSGKEPNVHGGFDSEKLQKLNQDAGDRHYRETYRG